MDRKSAEEEKAKLLMKFFDYAESPIQEWISEYLEVDVKELFPDYQDNSDVLGFQCEVNGNHYEGYLVSMEAGDDCYVDKELLNISEKYKKTCSMLFDAVHQVFPAVVGTIKEEYKKQVSSIRPLFDNSNMSFKLHSINQSAAALQVAVEAKKQLMPFLMNPGGQFDIDTMNNIRSDINKCEKVIESHTKEMLDRDEDKCKSINLNLEKFNRLYIAVEESDEYQPTDASLSRLPVFGLSYQDPEEESLVDKLKKQMEIQE
jgi:hypothetical protein